MAVAPGMAQFVFGYGSLLDQLRSRRRPEAAHVRLDGFRRAWNVAMDNAVDVPGYKYYLDPAGRRSPLFVTFLNLVETVGDAVNGALFEVGARELQALDARERNYTRVEVTDRVQGVGPGTVWTYIGTEDARDRYQRGALASRAAISRAYHDDVMRGFASLGTEAVAEYTATTNPPDCPVQELTRVDLSS